MSDSNATVNTPNMRFGASFLDFANHKHAVNDEVMMDKRTGQLVYKRNTDGKLIYYAQENVHLNNYMRQLKTLMTNNRQTYIRPIPSNCEYCDDTFFISYNTELIDFYFNEDEENKSLISGGKLLNPHPVAHSFTQETNGFFINLTGRPRDRAAISFLTSIYDRYYKDYNGPDEEAINIRTMYDLPGYNMSQAVVNYTVTYYDSTNQVYAQQTADAYVRINEVSYVPFTYEGIYPRTSVAYATIKINSISTPKLAKAIELLGSDAEHALFDTLLDNDDFKFITCNVSIFITTTDQNFSLPTTENTFIILTMGWSEFEEELVNAKSGGGGASGIVVSVEEPDTTAWSDITIWREIIRDVHGIGDEESTGAETNIDELEKSFGSIEYHSGNFTKNVHDIDDYYVRTILETESV